MFVCVYLCACFCPPVHAHARLYLCMVPCMHVCSQESLCVCVSPAHSGQTDVRRRPRARCEGEATVALTTTVAVNTSVLIVTNGTYYISVNFPRSPSDEDS